MKLGLGLYRHQLDAAHFRFARQCGCSHVVIHWVDYFRSARNNPRGDQPLGDDSGWGRAGNPARLWSAEELAAVRRAARAAGLEVAAVENFDPAHWDHVLLGGPRRAAQLEALKQTIREVGRAGIPVIGYNFSIAGVAGRVRGPWGRGGAEVVGVDGPLATPLPNGMAWNMVCDPAAPPGTAPAATHAELWQRVGEFLAEVLPVAEQAGVTLAAHPDDPPFEFQRGQPRLVWQPRLCQRLLDLHPSPRNQLEFCVGTFAEMSEGDLYATLDACCRQDRVAYVHLRNVRGKIPRYRETFIDEGDVDVPRVLRILHDNRFEGVIIPDHAPAMTCAAPWHAGMAHALGYLRALLQALGH